MKALDTQVGGSHYKNMAIQPVEFIEKNNLGYCVGNVIKYVCRYKDKNGLVDLKKARHYIDILIDMESERVYEDESQCLSVPQVSDDTKTTSDSTSLVNIIKNNYKPYLNSKNVSHEDITDCNVSLDELEQTAN